MLFDQEDVVRYNIQGALSTEAVFETLDEPFANKELARTIIAKLCTKCWYPKKREEIEAYAHFDAPERSYDLSASWHSFAERIKTETRYFFLNPGFLEFLNALALTIRRQGLIRVLSPDTSLFRARIHSPERSFTTARDLGTVPVGAARFANRMSPAGISAFYGADSSDAAIAETLDVNGLSGKVATVACFRPASELRIVDLTLLPAIPSLFDRASDIRRLELQFLRQFAAELSSPIEKDGREHIDYVPSQVISEFIKLVLGHAEDSASGAYKRFITAEAWSPSTPSIWDGRVPIHGVAYRSSRWESAKCFAMFISNSDCFEEEYRKRNDDYQTKTFGRVLGLTGLVLDPTATSRIEIDSWLRRCGETLVGANISTA